MVDHYVKLVEWARKQPMYTDIISSKSGTSVYVEVTSFGCTLRATLDRYHPEHQGATSEEAIDNCAKRLMGIIELREASVAQEEASKRISNAIKCSFP